MIPLFRKAFVYHTYTSQNIMHWLDTGFFSSNSSRRRDEEYLNLIMYAVAASVQCCSSATSISSRHYWQVTISQVQCILYCEKARSYYRFMQSQSVQVQVQGRSSGVLAFLDICLAGTALAPPDTWTRFVRWVIRINDIGLLHNLPSTVSHLSAHKP